MRPFSFPLVRVILLLLYAATAASAAPGLAPVTELGRNVLSRCDLVAKARVEKVDPSFRGVRMARLRLEKRLWGYEPKAEILLLYVEDFVAPDAMGATLQEQRIQSGPESLSSGNGGNKTSHAQRQQTKVPGAQAGGVRMAEGEEAVFFLKRKAESYEIFAVLSPSDPLFKTKRKRLSEVLRLENDAQSYDLRLQGAKRFFLSDLGDPQTWLRANSARELAGLAARFPEIFTSDETLDLISAATKEKLAPIRNQLERAVRSIDPSAGIKLAEEAERKEEARYKEQLTKEAKSLAAIRDPDLRAADFTRVGRKYGHAATRLLATYLDSDAAVERERAAQVLGRYGGVGASAPLRKALEREAEAHAASAMIYALGMLRDPGAVSVVSGRISDPALRAQALQALARIGSSDAIAALQRARKDADAATRALIDRLLSEEGTGG